MYEPPPGVPSQSGKIVKTTIGIINGRPVADQLTLDEQGFMLTHHETAVHNFYDDDEVRRVYYPEVERLVKEKTGAVAGDQCSITMCAMARKRRARNLACASRSNSRITTIR